MDRHLLMPSQHKHSPLSVRLPAEDREWLLSYAAVIDKAVNAVIAEAVAEYRARREGRDEEGQS